MLSTRCTPSPFQGLILYISQIPSYMLFIFASTFSPTTRWSSCSQSNKSSDMWGHLPFFRAMVLKRTASEDPFALCRWSQPFSNCRHAFYSNTSLSPSLSLAPSSSHPRTGVLHGRLHSPGRSLSSWPVSCYHRVVGRIKLDNIYEALKTIPSTE